MNTKESLFRCVMIICICILTNMIYGTILYIDDFNRINFIIKPWCLVITCILLFTLFSNIVFLIVNNLMNKFISRTISTIKNIHSEILAECLGCSVEEVKECNGDDSKITQLINKYKKEEDGKPATN